MKKRFGVLHFMASVLKIFGIVVAALAVLGGLITFILSFAGGDMFSAMGMDAAGGILVGLFAAFMMVLFGALYALFIYGTGELILLLISMEENTGKTVQLLEEVINEENPKK